MTLVEERPLVRSRVGATRAGKHLRQRYSVQPSRSKALRVVLWMTLLLSALLTMSGNPLLALWPPVLVGVTWALLALPFEMAMSFAIALFLSVNPKGVLPHEGAKWTWPLDTIGQAFYVNLPIKFSLADISLMILLVRALITIRLSDVGTGGIERRPMRPFGQACGYSAAALVAYVVWGYISGGSINQAYWQVGKLIWFPLIAIIASVAATRPQGIRRMRKALLFAASVKAIEAVLFKFTYTVPDGESFPMYVTTHSDSVLWATATCILIADWFEERKRDKRRMLLGLGALYALAMVFNNRRTVYVAVLAGAFFIVAVAHRPVKKQLAKLLTVGWPLLVIYIGLGLGTSSQSAIFKPVRMVESVVLQEDTSSDTRDIENTNLLITLRVRQFVGWGFGHPYIEVVQAYDVTQTGFENYRYVPHNSYLGLWAFGGMGFASIYFLPAVVGIFYAVQARRQSSNVKRRSAAAWSVCAVIAYLIQGWSDIGLQDWVAIMCAGVGLGIGGALPRLVAAEEAESAARAAALANRAPSPVEVARIVPSDVDLATP
jgi:hypothetical protein